VNQPYLSGFTSVSTPLDISGGNNLTNIYPNSTGNLNGTLVYVWSGTKFAIYTLDSGFPTGVGDPSDSFSVTSPTLNPGQLYYVANNSSTYFTNTVVGTVHVEGAGSGSIGVTTNTLTPGYNFVASKIPVAGGVTTVLGLTNVVTVVGGTPAGALDGDLVYTPNINAAGSFLGYNIVTFDSTLSTGFGDSSDSHSVPEPQIPVGGGFIFLNTTPNTVQWTQSF
jgi:hypothetical protein